jgi:hypothetical protein
VLLTIAAWSLLAANSARPLEWPAGQAPFPYLQVPPSAEELPPVCSRCSRLESHQDPIPDQKPTTRLLMQELRRAANVSAAGGLRDRLKAREALMQRAYAPQNEAGPKESLDRYLATADYPWISKDELQALAYGGGAGAPDAEPKLDVRVWARAMRWDDIKRLWDSVPSATALEPKARYLLLLQGLDALDALPPGALPFDDRAANAEHILRQYLDLLKDWRGRHPHVPLGPLHELARTANQPVGAMELVLHMIQEKTTKERLAETLRMDYVDAYWSEGPVGTTIPAMSQEKSLFPDTPDALDLWFSGPRDTRRWIDLQTEQQLATQIWKEDKGGPPPTPAELRATVQLLDGVLSGILRQQFRPRDKALAELPPHDDGISLRSLQREGESRSLAARLWLRAMRGRLAQLLPAVVRRRPLPAGGESGVIEEASRKRFPDDGNDADTRFLLSWLLFIDHRATFDELREGYRIAARGDPAAGRGAVAALARDELDRELMWLWTEAPKRFPRIPWRAEYVSETVVWLAHASVDRRGRPRTAASFVSDFASLIGSVDAMMVTPPPDPLVSLTRERFRWENGRSVHDPEVLRFLVWLEVGRLAALLQANGRSADAASVAREWAQTLEEGRRRASDLPWEARGWSEVFVCARALRPDQALPSLQRAAEDASELSSFVGLHERFVRTWSQRIGPAASLIRMDVRARQAFAVLGLAWLQRSLERLQLQSYRGNPYLLVRLFLDLQERLANEYPHLDWERGGPVEGYLLHAVRDGKEPDTSYVRSGEFAQDWKLANALAAAGFLKRLRSASAATGPLPEASAVAAFVRDNAGGHFQATQGQVLDSDARANNALIALAALVVNAAREGRVPGQPRMAGPELAQWIEGLHRTGLPAELSAWCWALAARHGS